MTPSRAAYLKLQAGIDPTLSPFGQSTKLKKIKQPRVKVPVTKEEVIESSLKETFDFYAR